MDSFTATPTSSVILHRTKPTRSSPVAEFPNDSRMPIGQSHFAQETENCDNKQNSACQKVPKRKRLAKACDACHKSKRRCDGTAPCSNCYFASKECTYTDASGRPVPAPRAGHPSEEGQAKPRHPIPDGSSSSGTPAIPTTSRSHDTEVALSLVSTDEHKYTEQSDSRKRRRIQQPQGYSHIPTAGPPIMMETPSTSRSRSPDPALTRELVNLFFTHCHPSRLIIHKPSFSAALSHNKVPSYLLQAIYCLAAPLSKQPGLRTSPARNAGKPYFNETVSMMFDSTGRLICPPDLTTAQALCFLQIHTFQMGGVINCSTRYHDLALDIVESLGARKPDNPIMTPVPSAGFVHGSIERECTRRVFWLTYFVESLCLAYTHRTTSRRRHDHDLTLRLPADETSFELAVHATLPEYLHFPPPRMRYASEFGHLIRISRIMIEFETRSCQSCSNRYNGRSDDISMPGSLGHAVPEDDRLVGALIQETESNINAWALSLADHLQFTEQNLQLQLAMFETSSNTGAWCFCFMHVVHAGCVLAINEFRQRTQRSPLLGQQEWALGCLNQIVSSLGNRAKNSFILGAILWPLLKFCKSDNPRLQEWNAAYQDLWGVEIKELVLSTLSPHTPEPPSPSDSNRTARPANYPYAIPHPMMKASDLEMDIILNGSDARSERGDGPLLPSLKASGLLDSWKPFADPLANSASTWAVPISATSSSARSLSTVNADPTRHSNHSHHSASGMPVGLQWLANES